MIVPIAHGSSHIRDVWRKRQNRKKPQIDAEKRGSEQTFEGNSDPRSSAKTGGLLNA